MSDIFGVIHFM